MHLDLIIMPQESCNPRLQLTYDIVYLLAYGTCQSGLSLIHVISAPLPPRSRQLTGRQSASVAVQPTLTGVSL